MKRLNAQKGSRFVEQKNKDYFSDKQTLKIHNKLQRKLKKSATGVRFAPYDIRNKLQ